VGIVKENKRAISNAGKRLEIERPNKKLGDGP
jgi:hypothetical protein